MLPIFVSFRVRNVAQLMTDGRRRKERNYNDRIGCVPMTRSDKIFQEFPKEATFLNGMA
jgi:hypothetical protein